MSINLLISLIRISSDPPLRMEFSSCLSKALNFKMKKSQKNMQRKNFVYFLIHKGVCVFETSMVIIKTTFLKRCIINERTKRDEVEEDMQ